MQEDSDLCPGLLSLLSALAFFLIKVQIYLLRWMTSNASRIGICLPLIHFLLHVPTSLPQVLLGQQLCSTNPDKNRLAIKERESYLISNMMPSMNQQRLAATRQ